MKKQLQRDIVMILLGVFILSVSCNKDRDVKNVVIDGQVRVWGLNEQAAWTANPPMVELYALKILHTGDVLSPTYTYKVPIAVVRADQNAGFRFETELERDVEYYISVLDFDTSRYLFPIEQEVAYVSEQVVNPHLTARSWVMARFLNPAVQPGDTFFYYHGIGTDGAGVPAITQPDITMPWMYMTWGGPANGKNLHSVGGTISRQGVRKDTTVLYDVVPADTSLVDILW